MDKIIQELKDYSLWRHSLDIIPQRIAEIEERMLSLGGGGADAPVKSSGTNKQEEKLCACIDEKNELQKTLEARLKKKEYIEEGLSRLNEDELKILDIFYMQGLKYHEALEKSIVVTRMSESVVDRTRRRALRKYSLCEFGK
jgi:hypothetical protein